MRNIKAYLRENTVNHHKLVSFVKNYLTLYSKKDTLFIIETAINSLILLMLNNLFAKPKFVNY